MVSLHPKRVLVPTDFSDQASQAVDQGVDLVDDAEHLTVLHVAPALSSFSEGDPLVGWNMVSDEDRTKHLLEMLQKKFADPKYEKVQFRIAYGTPAEEIARIAEAEGVELIVLPSHGRTGLARLMIGSVAERVVRLAHCPVLVLRE
ncbi:universal stress protein [Bythopirellula polymerisocia]|uniref:Universal stress protein F n=1 Tax=Bythopirellula polymerisocia TaxID=2528003 RepID=A0A5C6CXR1_9BACT|nr:universal stress protein [Bythopirellula polymerisocia]TWU29743.1 Universal stress protein F [Bythopirellula polymerisocia]